MTTSPGSKTSPCRMHRRATVNRKSIFGKVSGGGGASHTNMGNRHRSVTSPARTFLVRVIPASHLGM
jgi:hypothetical protein